MKKQQHHHHHHQQQLLLRLATLKCFIILKALLLNGQVAKGEGAMSCYSESNATCPMFKNIALFPFLSSQACGSASSFVISGCTASRNTEKPTWPNFVNATDHTLGPPYVMALYNPFQIPPPLHQVSRLDTKYSSNITNSLKPSNATINPQFGLINLTWSQTLINKTTCEIRAPLRQISQYLPQSINLTSFAHSAFQFTPSNIVLLFNCSSSYPSQQYLRKNSTACTSFGNFCGLPKEESSNCYQYTPWQDLNLPQAMKDLNCENAMFFVVSQQDSMDVRKWSPGLIQLNWSIYDNSWISQNLNLCKGCLQTNGSCGYNASDYFQCYCADNTVFSTNCTADKGTIVRRGCNDGLLCHAGAISGVVGAVIVIVVFSTLVVALYYHHKKRKGFVTKSVPFRLSKRSTRRTLFGSSSLIIRHVLDLDGLMECPIEYNYASIVFATKSFSDLLGVGGFGTVYKGVLGDAKNDVHMQIAVKVMEVRSKHSKKHFFNEVVAIGRIHHVHVVRLLGFCIQENHEMLVYEYVVNGSLDKWLFHCSDSQKQVLLWEQRYAIAVGIAKGLSYLHEECRHRIVHCDIKPQNILLDEQMCPKIADFGLARLMGREESRVTTLARGTPGYMAPEFWRGGESHLSTKFDVYSYGMVLLELISGQQNFGDEKCFPERAFEAAMGGDYESIMDVKMGIDKILDDDEFEGMQWQRVRTTVLVALWCIQDHPMNRPSMSEVVQYLQGIAPVNERPPRPTIASTISISAQGHAYLSNDLHSEYNITPISGGRN